MSANSAMTFLNDAILDNSEMTFLSDAMHDRIIQIMQCILINKQIIKFYNTFIK